MQQRGIQAGGDVIAGGDMAGRDVKKTEVVFSMDDWFAKSIDMVNEVDLTTVEHDYVLNELEALKGEANKGKKKWDLKRMAEIVQKIAIYAPAAAQALQHLFKLPVIR